MASVTGDDGPDTVEDDSHDTAEDDTTLASVRRAVFTIVVIGALGLYGVLMGEMLTFAFTGWFEEPGIHHLHELTMFGAFWLGIAGLAVQVYRPADRVNAVLVSALILVPLAVMAVTSGSPIAMMPVVFGGVGVAAILLHPAGSELAGISLDVPGTRVLGGLVALATIPIGVFAAEQVITQYTATDAHADFVHYGGMAVATVLIPTLGLLAALRPRDRRFPAWGSGLLAAYIGVATVTYPAQPSNPGRLWGALAVVWGVAFIAAFEWTNSR